MLRGPNPIAGGCVGAWTEAKEAATSAADGLVSLVLFHPYWLEFAADGKVVGMVAGPDGVG